MLEYFTYKKVKKHQAEKRAHSQAQTPTTPTSPLRQERRAPTQVRTPTPPTPSPLLNDEDENFLERIVSAEGTPPPLPTRPTIPIEAGDPTGNQAQMVVHDGNENRQEHHHHKHDRGKGAENEPASGEKKPGKFAFLSRIGTKKHRDGLQPKPVVPANEAATEEDDINRVLEDLNLAAVNNRAFSLSKESQQLVQQFTVVLKDLINGVPTAYDDLTHLLDHSQGTLSKSYEQLPGFLKKLIAQLPDKMTKNIAPELLAVASEGAALGGKGGLKGLFQPSNLKDLVAKPGAVVSLLKTIMNALKLRWPAFMGTNVLLSLGLFVLLFVFWYCHKRGREVRLEREAKVDSQGRIIELDDDPMIADRPRGAPRSQTEVDRPPHHRHHVSSRDRVQSERPLHSRSHSEDVRVDRRPTSSRKRTTDSGTGSGTGSGTSSRRRRRSDEFVVAGERRRDDRR